MRKALLAVPFFFAIGSLHAKAGKDHASATSHLSLGPIAAIGHSWTSNLKNPIKFKPSAALGIGLVYSKAEHWGFGVQALASYEGLKEELTIDYISPSLRTADYAINPVYLRLPLQAIYFFGHYGDRVRPKIYLGPSVAFLIDEKSRLDDKEAGGTHHTDFFRHFDAGLNAGAGANIRLGRLTWLNLDLNYYQGFIDAFDYPGYPGLNANQYLRLNVGLMWGL